jgi:hypothetical protein
MQRTPARARNVEESEATRKTETPRIQRLKDALVETLGIAEEVRALGVLMEWYSDYAGDDIDARVLAAGAACVERTARRISDDLSSISQALGQMAE